MCISAMTLMALSTGVSVIGQVRQGMAARQAADANARAMDLQAAQTAEAAKQEAARIRKAGEKAAGAARAQMAASGIDVNSGSAININEDIYRQSESDAFNTLLTGERKATALQTSASSTRAAGRNTMAASVLSAGATGLQGWRAVRQPAADPLAALYGSNRSLGD
jgi:hypothetical protein